MPSSIYQPTPIRDLVFNLMSDGRPRTLDDVCIKLKRNSRSLRASTKVVLKSMTKDGTLSYKFWHQIGVWELQSESSDNVSP